MKPTKDWKQEFDEQFLAFTDPDIVDGFAKDKIKQFISNLLVEKEKEAYERGRRDGIKQTTEHTQAMNDLAVKSLQESLKGNHE